MVLSDKGILALVDNNSLKIEPFNTGNLRGASYDVSLDGEFTLLQEKSGLVDLSDQGAVNRLYGPHLPAEGFILKPGQYCLAALAETIALPDDVVAEVVPRTRFTRLGLLVSKTFCNPSYSGRLRIGLFNASGNNLRFSPGIRIAQLVFHKLDQTPSQERLYRNQQAAAYQDEDGFTGFRVDSDWLSPEDREPYSNLMDELFGEGK